MMNTILRSDQKPLEMKSAIEMILQKKSVFLAGPSYRDPSQGKSWREDAIDLFNSKSSDLVLFLPEPFHGEYERQVKWEALHLHLATVIMFWVPRDLDTLPGFTTNIEFGEWYKSGKVVLGFPPHAPKMRYLEYKAKKHQIPMASGLEAAVDQTLKLIEGRS